MKHLPSFEKKRKKNFVWGLFLFVFSVGILSYLSFPTEHTWIELNIDNRRLERAVELLGASYAKNPDNQTVATKYADTLIALGNMERAKQIIKYEYTANPENIEWKRRLGNILLDENDPAGAARVVPAHFRSKEFWTRLADEYYKKSQYGLAEEAFMAANEDISDKSSLWDTIAKWRAQARDSLGEKNALENALQYDPDNTSLLSRLLRNRVEAHDTSAALKLADKLRGLFAMERFELETLYQMHHADKNYAAAGEALKELMARADTVPADWLAYVSLLYEQKDFTKAKEVLEKLSSQPEDFLAGIHETMRSQKNAVQAAILSQAASKGDAETIEKAVKELENPAQSPAATELRSLAYACINLADFFKKNGQGKDFEKNLIKAAGWILKAKEILNSNKAILPLSDKENIHLAADIAERSQDWPEMLNAWHAAERIEGPQPQVLLGMVRAYLKMKEYELAWQNLLKAEKFAENGEADQQNVASHYLAFAAELPDDYPDSAEKIRYVDKIAYQQLNKNWDDALAKNLFFRNLAEKNLEEADSLLNKLMARGSASLHDHLGLAEVSLALYKESGKRENHAIQKRQRELAHQNALAALKMNDPESFLRLLYIFRILEDRKQIAGLLQRIERSAIPLTPTVVNQLAEAYAFLGNQEREFELVVKLARITKRLEDWKNAIDRLYWGGKPEDALLAVNEAEKLYPGNTELLGRRIQIYADNKKYLDAIQAFQKAEEHYPDLAGKMTSRQLATVAAVYENAQRYGKARQFYSLSLEKDANNLAAVYGLANLARRQGNIPQAIRHLREIVTKDPKNHWAQLDLANLLPDGNRQYNEVLANTKADRKGNISKEEKNVRALALWRSGQVQEAISLYKSILDKKNPHSLNDYAQLLMDAKKYGEAKKVLEDAMHLFPAHTRSYRLYANCLIQDKNYAGAEQSLKNALRQAPHNPEILREIAYLQKLQGKTMAAQKSLMEAARR